jgi:predicted DCC family thiol-disulfide oxidoreductase YuxK
MQNSLRPVLLYDADCPLCLRLAAFVTRRSGLKTAAWQDFCQTPEGVAAFSEDQRRAPADRLRLLTDEALFEGEDAWAYLIANWRDLKALDWLAAQMGLRQPLARGAAKAGYTLRRLCTRCPK